MYILLYYLLVYGLHKINIILLYKFSFIVNDCILHRKIIQLVVG